MKGDTALADGLAEYFRYVDGLSDDWIERNQQQKPKEAPPPERSRSASVFRKV